MFLKKKKKEESQCPRSYKMITLEANKVIKMFLLKKKKVIKLLIDYYT